MAEYKKFSCPYGDDFEGGDECDRCDNYELCMETPTVDVIERSEYEKLQKENEYLQKRVAFWKSQCKYPDVKELRSKISRAIEEIKELYTEWENLSDDAKLETNPFGAVLNIMQRNIGE